MEPRSEELPLSEQNLGSNSNTTKQILKIRSAEAPWMPIHPAEPILSQHTQPLQQPQPVHNSTLFNLLTQHSHHQQLSAEDNNIIEEFLNYELPNSNSSQEDPKMLSIPTTLSLGTI